MRFNKTMPVYTKFNSGLKSFISVTFIFGEHLSKYQYNKILVANLARDKETEFSLKLRHLLHLICGFCFVFKLMIAMKCFKRVSLVSGKSS